MKRYLYEHALRVPMWEYVVRFWVDAEDVPFSECVERCVTACAKRDWSPPPSDEDAAVDCRLAAEALLDSWSKVNAVEVVHGSRGCGTVAYRDWP